MIRVEQECSGISAANDLEVDRLCHVVGMMCPFFPNPLPGVLQGDLVSVCPHRRQRQGVEAPDEHSISDWRYSPNARSRLAKSFPSCTYPPFKTPRQWGGASTVDDGLPQVIPLTETDHLVHIWFRIGCAHSLLASYKLLHDVPRLERGSRLTSHRNWSRVVSLRTRRSRSTLCVSVDSRKMAIHRCVALTVRR